MAMGSYRVRYGEPPCVDCSHAFVHEIEYRCWGCDRGVCAVCAVVVRSRGEVYCRECAGEREEEG